MTKKEQIEGKTIIEWETLLSDLNRKSFTVNNFSEYVKLKNNVNEKLFGFYENYLFRKLKLNSYINMLKSEQKLINQFKITFGNPEEVVIGIGDFEQRKHRKFKEPVKGKGFRALFRKNGYDLSRVLPRLPYNQNLNGLKQ